MELRQIRYFIEVAQRQSFSVAAKRLSVAQSAISRQVAMLEGELGALMFTRDGRKITLTDCGRRFLPEAQAAYGQFEKLKATRWDAAGELSGALEVGMPPTLLRVLAGPTITAFHSRHPRVIVRLAQAPTASLRIELLEGHIDLAVVSSLDRISDLDATPLASERVYLVGPADADFGDEPQMNPSRLAEYPQIVSPNGKRILQSRGSAAGARVSIIAEVRTTEVALDLIELGNGYSVMAGCAFAHRLAAGRVRAVELTDVFIGWLIARRNEACNDDANQFFERALRETTIDAVRDGAWPSLVEASIRPRH